MYFCPLRMRLKTNRHPSKKTATHCTENGEFFLSRVRPDENVYYISHRISLETTEGPSTAPRVVRHVFSLPSWKRSAFVGNLGNWSPLSRCQVKVVIEMAMDASLRSRYRCGADVWRWLCGGREREKENDYDSGIQSAFCKQTRTHKHSINLSNPQSMETEIALFALLLGSMGKTHFTLLAQFSFWAHPIKWHRYISLVFICTGSNPN